jgi:hypothetical protein
VILGYEGIPEKFRAGIAALADTPFRYTEHSFNSIVRSTLARATRVIEGAGGKVTPEEILVPHQRPSPPALEQWEIDPPSKRAEFSDPDWSFSSDFTARTMHLGSFEWTAMVASVPGAEASFRFRGTGVAIVGMMVQSGGRADVYLDGAKAGEIDAFIVSNTSDNDLWHRVGLASGEHTVRIVTRGERDSRSTGTDVGIERAIVYGR